MMTRICVRLRIFGLVHGVFFRASLATVASNEGISGWVKNVPDGSVEALLEGDEAKVMRVVAWAHHGPPRARVDSLKTERQRVRNLRGFRIEG
jgi:acylphosphatase